MAPKFHSGATLTTVRSPEDLASFIDLPWSIYKDSAHWVPPLKNDIRDILTPKNPFWQHAERELFLAVRNGAGVARCAAIIDRTHLALHKDDCGFFGFFECIDDKPLARELLDAAGAWLKSKGMRRMRGPASPSFNEECGLLIEGFDDPPAILMTYNPPYYAGLLEASGLAKAKDLLSYELFPFDPVPRRIATLAQRAGRSGKVRIRPLRMNRWKEELALIRDIYNEAWEGNWGFTPMSDAELDLMAEKLRPIVHPDAIHFAVIDGREAAFSIILPDVNQVLARLNGRLGILGALKFLYYFRKIDRLRLVTLGVRKAFRNRGLEVLLYVEAWMIARKKNWARAELGWILEDNAKMVGGMEAMGGRVTKRHRIYEGPVPE